MPRRKPSRGAKQAKHNAEPKLYSIQPDPNPPQDIHFEKYVTEVSDEQNRDSVSTENSRRHKSGHIGKVDSLRVNSIHAKRHEARPQPRRRGHRPTCFEAFFGFICGNNRKRNQANVGDDEFSYAPSEKRISVSVQQKSGGTHIEGNAGIQQVAEPESGEFHAPSTRSEPSLHENCNEPGYLSNVNDNKEVRTSKLDNEKINEIHANYEDSIVLKPRKDETYFKRQLKSTPQAVNKEISADIVGSKSNVHLEYSDPGLKLRLVRDLSFAEHSTAILPVEIGDEIPTSPVATIPKAEHATKSESRKNSGYAEGFEIESAVVVDIDISATKKLRSKYSTSYETGSNSSTSSGERRRGSYDVQEAMKHPNDVTRKASTPSEVFEDTEPIGHIKCRLCSKSSTPDLETEDMDTKNVRIHAEHTAITESTNTIFTAASRYPNGALPDSIANSMSALTYDQIIDDVPNHTRFSSTAAAAAAAGHVSKATRKPTSSTTVRTVEAIPKYTSFTSTTTSVHPSKETKKLTPPPTPIYSNIAMLNYTSVTPTPPTSSPRYQAQGSLNEMVKSKSAAVPSYIGLNKGFRWENNSCYMDATLFSMFYGSSVFERILHENQGSVKVRNTLKEIVSTLWKYNFCEEWLVRKFRGFLGEINPKLQNGFADPEEFLYTLLEDSLDVDPFISYAGGVQDIMHMITLDTQDISSATWTTTQHLLELSMNENQLKFESAPDPALFLQLPRCDGVLQRYQYVIPSLELDLSNFLPANQVASNEHIMSLASVICIRHQHYTCFHKCNGDWVYFDSMYGYGNSMVEDASVIEPHLQALEDGMNIEIKDLPFMAMRIISDAHICIYVSKVVHTAV